MKILIATPVFAPDIGGPATHLAECVPHFTAAGDTVTVVTASNGDGMASDGVVRVSRRGLAPARTIRYIRALARHARSSDLLYINDMSSVGLAGLAVALWFRMPYVVRIGGDFVWEHAFQKGRTTLGYTAFQGREPGLYRLRRFIGSLILKHARRVIVPSVFLKEVVVLWGIPKERIAVIKNVVDFSRLGRAGESGEDVVDDIRTRKSRGARVIVATGRFVKWKHFDLLIRAAATREDIHLLLFGSGPEEFSYRSLVRELAVSKRVVIGESLSRDAHFLAIKEADCFALVSEGETFSFASLEALYAGTPLVLLRAAALPEIFGAYEGRGVTFVDEPTVPLLAAALGASHERPREELRAELLRENDAGAYAQKVREALLSTVDGVSER